MTLDDWVRFGIFAGRTIIIIIAMIFLMVLFAEAI